MEKVIRLGHVLAVFLVVGTIIGWLVGVPWAAAAIVGFSLLLPALMVLILLVTRYVDEGPWWRE